MPVYTVNFYDIDANSVFGNAGTSLVYAGPAIAAGSSVINDTGTGANGLVLTDDNAGENTTTSTSTINGATSTNALTDAEIVWTVRDTATGETFEVVQFNVESGAAAGNYTLSEVALVPGRTYEVLARDTIPEVGQGFENFAYADYEDGIVQGTAGDDVIDENYTGDTGGDRIDAQTVTSNVLSWESLGADNTDIAQTGASATLGGIDVTVSYNDQGPGQTATISNTTIYNDAGAGETFDTDSSLFLYGDNSGAQTGSDTAEVTIDFDTAAGSLRNPEVENVTFRISDIDLNPGGFVDTISVYAYDLEGNLVPVILSTTGDVDINAAGDEATGTAATTANTASGSLLVTIPGPVASIVIDYGNNGTAPQAVNVSDIHFDSVYEDLDNTVEAGDGNDFIDGGRGDDILNGGADNDTILGGSGDDIIDGGTGDDTLSGGTGNDTIYAGDGDDTIYAGSGDTIYGGAGQDTIIIDPSQLEGNPDPLNPDTITIIGDETDDGTGDVLDMNGLMVPGSVVRDADDPESGYATLIDGTIIRFENIETLICFGRGTRIETPFGPRKIETLKVGDLVLTRDHGPQPLRWIGSRGVEAKGDFAPIEIKSGALGNTSDLIVSPQHRMLLEDWRSELLFGQREVFSAAKHLINDTTIYRREGGVVEYFHMLFDAHEIVYAEGAASESFHPSQMSLTGVADAARDELFNLFPDLRTMPSGHGPTARPCLKAHEAGLLVA
ncbi:hemolysin type calcium-binding protein [Pacificibacter maritimus]|uniref:Hemolysin type calcium-binding protein n=1 Tax=Pacificibacter maritimus TaxID=762213 RepID=A0A3N4UWF0_9RHOB|nr:Hint domain-containing protein [Pacificibacter maritimus]RPE71881.1 hemolysin type calcium-binding protein [Pacificibacter maritimus]